MWSSPSRHTTTSNSILEWNGEEETLTGTRELGRLSYNPEWAPSRLEERFVLLMSATAAEMTDYGNKTSIDESDHRVESVNAPPKTQTRRRLRAPSDDDWMTVAESPMPYSDADCIAKAAIRDLEHKQFCESRRAVQIRAENVASELAQAQLETERNMRNLSLNLPDDVHTLTQKHSESIDHVIDTYRKATESETESALYIASETVKLKAAEEKKKKKREKERQKLDEEEKKKREKEKERQKLDEEKRKVEEDKKREEKVVLETEKRELDGATAEMQHRHAILTELKTRAAPLVSSSTAEDRRTRMDIKKTINVLVQQISASVKQVHDKSTMLCSVLDEARNVSDAAYAYAIDCLTDRVSIQGEVQVHLHPESAYPIAEVTMNVLKRHSEAAIPLWSIMSMRCPYIAPLYMVKGINEDRVLFMKRIGYHGDEGAMEDILAYHDRMGGYISLYAAMLQAPAAQLMDGPFNLNVAWTWLARVCNQSPRRVTARLLVEFLSVAGYEMQKKFGSVFWKIVSFIIDDYVDRIPKWAVSPAMRLKQMLIEWKTKGQVTIPAGRHF